MGRTLQSIVVGVLLIAANSPPSRADGAREDEQLNAAVAVENDSGDFQALEKLVLRTSHARAFREDGRLTLFFGDDQQLTIQDHDCPSSRMFVESCVSYYLLADLPSRHAFVVLAKHQYIGRREIWLIDDRSGRQATLPAVPQFGLGGSEFITFDNDVAYGKPGIAIWQWRDGTAQAIWRHDIKLDPLYHATALVRWAKPDAISLDLWCSSGPHWSARALRGPDGWRLETKWPKFDGRACGNPNSD